METKSNLVKAMEKFEDTLDVIYAMLDNDYISVSNIARLINKILDTDRITASKLNRVLCKIGVLDKVKKQDYDLQLQQGQKPSRYRLGNDGFISHSQKKYGDNYSFFMFKPNIYMIALKINVLHDEVTDEMAINLINLFKRKKYVDVKIVRNNLEMFQLLMKHLF